VWEGDPGPRAAPHGSRRGEMPKREREVRIRGRKCARRGKGRELRSPPVVAAAAALL